MKKIPRIEVIKFITKCRLIFNSRDELLDLLEREYEDETKIENEVFETLVELYLGVSNGYLSELYEGITGERVEVIGPVVEMFRCPCCNFKTLTEVYDQSKGTGYDICDYCNWEDDGTVDINSRSSVNQGCMKEYRDKIRMQSNLFYRGKWLNS